MKKILFILPLLFIISSVAAQAARCPDLDGLQLTKFTAPSPMKAPFTISGSRMSIGGDSCEYSISPNSGLTEAAIEGTLTIKLKTAIFNQRCPLLTGLEVKIQDASPAKLPYRIVKSGDACKSSLAPDTRLEEAFRAGTLEFNEKKE